ncbi:class I SAM-dependent methyltransferase [Asticcacaulis sp. 201]|uniref:class I SAM-dependent methyltransferase n=1 Tax=Asticcacaulis sp. 201 TaxID=3028787 RepID=UPI002915F2DE|nr:SAM-dependent methyltransferase [Asticcacaulis sp. 201]MDV6329750.1 SAM-dependent methyltransferase [Asticcacaulis sp. 201]
MSLKERLIEQITQEGPMSVAGYMARCLLDPIDGYYTRHVRLGADGDFLTAPLVSQMFGEMIGVWVAQMWQALGAPGAFRLVEIGGGDGKLMSDILRVAARVPGLHDAARVTLVEPSPTLRALQAKAVPDAQFVPSLDRLDDDLPVLVIANELLDCLPARQFVRGDNSWFERCVGVQDGRLSFGLVPVGEDFVPPFSGKPGQVIEISPPQTRLAETLALLLKAATGAALLIDYGRDQPEAGDTLQALYRHEKRDPLDAPGEHDLTVWADFPAVANAAARAGVSVSPIVTQGLFLSRLGIGARHSALAEKNPDQAAKLQRQYDRLMAPDQMGDLFKVLGMGFPVDINLFALEAGSADR